MTGCTSSHFARFVSNLLNIDVRVYGSKSKMHVRGYFSKRESFYFFDVKMDSYFYSRKDIFSKCSARNP